MSKLKYKVGDRVRIKSLDWYNENKTTHGYVWVDNILFDSAQSLYCGCELTIRLVTDDSYYVIENDYYWTDEMIEGLVEEEIKSEPKFHIGDWATDGDVLAEDSCIFIIQKLGDNGTAAKTYCTLHNDGYFEKGSILYFDIDSTKPATEDEKQKLFRAIKDNGYKWNSETKTLEKLIEPLDVPTMTTEFVKEHGLPCPEGFIFKDENGNIINATKIVLEKVNTLKTQSDNMETETHKGYCTTEEETTNKSKKVAWFTFWDNDFADKVELDLSNRELIHEDGKWFVVKKKKEYPKTYDDCCEVLVGRKPNPNEISFGKMELCLVDLDNTQSIDFQNPLLFQLNSLFRLLMCRNAYWKIAGEEMGLGKPWKPDWIDGEWKWCVCYSNNNIEFDSYKSIHHTFSFPTKEMRDAFYENFKELIEQCKELL